MKKLDLMKGLPKVPTFTPEDDWIVSLLLEKHLITPEQAEEAREEAKLCIDDTSAVDLLLASKMVTSPDVAKIRAKQFGAGFINLRESRIDSEALASISAVRAHCYRVIPFQKEGNSITIAIADPSDLATMEQNFQVASEEDIQWALDKFYSSGKEEGERLRKELAIVWTE